MSDLNYNTDPKLNSYQQISKATGTVTDDSVTLIIIALPGSITWTTLETCVLLALAIAISAKNVPLEEVVGA